MEGRVESDRGAGAVEPAGASSERSRGGRLLCWRAAVVGIVLLGVLAASAAAIAGPGHFRLAALLAARDPGGSVPNGNTIVVTGRGARVYGVRDRRNFVAALGSHETIVGGNRDDDLASLGDGVTIIAGRGNDLLYGGRDATLIAGIGARPTRQQWCVCRRLPVGLGKYRYRSAVGVGLDLWPARSVGCAYRRGLRWELSGVGWIDGLGVGMPGASGCRVMVVGRGRR